MTRACPKCHTHTNRTHCNVYGCDWWICTECRLMFNRHGNTAAHPRQP